MKNVWPSAQRQYLLVVESIAELTPELEFNSIYLERFCVARNVSSGLFSGDCFALVDTYLAVSSFSSRDKQGGNFRSQYWQFLYEGKTHKLIVGHLIALSKSTKGQQTIQYSLVMICGLNDHWSACAFRIPISGSPTAGSARTFRCTFRAVVVIDACRLFLDWAFPGPTSALDHAIRRSMSEPHSRQLAHHHCEQEQKGRDPGHIVA